MRIRKAELKDIEEIKEIEKEAFSKYLNFYFSRRIDNLKINFEICNGGLFVEEEDGHINGFIFARALGSIGWIGTFAVKSTEQGKGVGKRLLNTAIEYLKNEKCEIIGLETLNTAFKNIEIYLKNDFLPIAPSLQLSKKVEEIKIVEVSANYDSEFIQDLAKKILKGYNPIAAFKNAFDNNWGKVLEFKQEDFRFGAALLEFKPKLDTEKEGSLTVHTLLIDEISESKIKIALRDIYSYAYSNGFENIDIFVNSSNALILKMLIEDGFSIKNSRVRMLLKGKYEPQGVECSRWIM